MSAMGSPGKGVYHPGSAAHSWKGTSLCGVDHENLHSLYVKSVNTVDLTQLKNDLTLMDSVHESATQASAEARHNRTDSTLKHVNPSAA